MIVRVRKNKLDRWIIRHPERDDLAWSGSRWVFVDSDGFPSGRWQISNLGTEDEAVTYAASFGFIADSLQFVRVGDPKARQMAAMVVSTEQAPGAILNGSKVRKVKSSGDDGHADGARATVIGSLGPTEMQGRKNCYGYFVIWDDTPGVPCFIADFRIEKI